jgi:hypothetical protein
LPVWQSREPLRKVVKGIWLDVMSGGRKDGVEGRIDGTVVETTKGVEEVRGDEKLDS